MIPFRAEITYLPITDKDKARLHQFGSKLLSGIFLGYEQQEGGGWSGDLLVLDWEEIEQAEHFSDIHIKRFKASEVETSKLSGNFRFPLAEGLIRQPGSERHLTARKRRSPSKSSPEPEGEGSSSEDDEEIEEEKREPLDPDSN